MVCAATAIGAVNTAFAARAGAPATPHAETPAPARALLFDEAAEAAPTWQLAANNPSLAGLLVQNTVQSQSQCGLIYLDFRGAPDQNGDNRPDNRRAPYEVTFFDNSDIPEEFGEPEAIEWFPLGFTIEAEDGEITFGPSFVQDVGGGQESFTYRYEEPGIYDVCFRMLINGEWCPPRGTDPEGNRLPPYCKNGFVVVSDEAAPEQPPTATFDLTDQVRDKEGLLPLTDWVPLWNFRMGYSPEEPAPRILESFTFTIRGDGRDEDDLGYRTFGGPTTADILEFGIFAERYCDCAEGLDSVFDELLMTFDSNAVDRFGRMFGSVNGFALPNGSLASTLVYNIVLAPGGVPIDPGAPILAGPDGDGNPGGNSYYIAVRTTAVWQSGITLGSDFLGARMVFPQTGEFPVDDEGGGIDTYPEFPVEPETAYSSSFSVFDVTGTPADSFIPEFFDAWNRPRFGYTPTQEWIRPRFDLANIAFEAMGANILDLRQLVPLEEWIPVVGINVHSTKAVHFDEFESQTQYAPGQAGLSSGEISQFRNDGLDKDGAQLQEVNLIVTDIGADPAEPGSGGLDPRDALNSVFNGITYVNGLDTSSGDVTFSGIGVFFDSNNNGIFDPPIPFENGGGVNMTSGADAPLISAAFIGEILNGDWEYVPFPPEGGDPWWKIKLRFAEGQRRSQSDIAEADNTVGYVEKIPEGADRSPYFSDYFVVVRPDSGFTDSSTLVGDGVGMPMGADFRVFVEPRRFNARTGHQDGGIYVNSMIPPMGWRLSESQLAYPWQDDHRWGDFEPWWNQRTVNKNSTKPLRHGIDVHDLVMVYESTSSYAFATNYIHGSFFSVDSLDADGIFAAPGTTFFGAPELSPFDLWIDPLGLQAAKFFYGYSVDATRWLLEESITYGFESEETSFGISFQFDDGIAPGQFAYEQAGFLRNADFGQGGPRSNVFAVPPTQPTLPAYATWPGGLDSNEYPRASDWPKSQRATRMLTQKADIAGDHTAMLGINLVSANDPRVNQQRRTLTQITVAFWGPEFEPNQLAPLDPSGASPTSGVLLWEDTDNNGIFIGRPQADVVPVSFFDEALRLNDLRWPDAPELVDLNGDGTPDDMDGDGVVDTRDRAWVLRIVPQQNWVIPDRDRRDIELATVPGGTKSAGSGPKGGVSLREPVQVSEDDVRAAAMAKLLDPAGANRGGDDLFISVRFSDTAKRFQKLRAVVPATLPERPAGQRRAGVQFFPEVNTAPDAFIKQNPEEDPVQDYYGHDMLEVNVPVKITKLTAPSQTIAVGGPGVAMLGIDVATNRPENTLATGTNGTGLDGRFSVDGAGWTQDAFSGQYLIDSRFESFEITANTNNQLQLLSGQPANGAWRIVKEPTFLEQVTIEIYPELPDVTLPDTEGAKQTSGFNPEDSLLPLNINQSLSGVALYRDNNHHAENRPGVWDPGIDIPLRLDAAPEFLGQPGEPTQVRFVFSTPGVDEHPIPRAQQTRNRQWVPDTFGGLEGHPDFGADFFVVVRTSDRLRENDAFSMGIVSWGPNTPTAPDPDNWTNAWQPIGQTLPPLIRDEFVKFQDFPWADQGLGFVTMLDDPPMYYFFEEHVAKREVDDNGFNYIRSTSARKVKSNSLIAARGQVGPQTVVISNTTPENDNGRTELPSQTLDGESVSFLIAGQGFGTRPQVQLSGFDVTVTSATDTQIGVTVTVREDSVPTEPIVLTVRNPDTGREASRSDLFRLVEGSPLARPVIADVSPGRADSAAFPVRVNGSNFDAVNGVRVRFGSTTMPVISASGGAIVVGFPAGGIAKAGIMDVEVTNLGSGLKTVAAGAFEFVSEPVVGQKSLLCGPAGGGGSQGASDLLIVLLTVAALVALRARRTVR
jgi:hypothetical protein